MKYVIYTILKNEIDQIEGFMINTEDADEIVFLDTGSTDGSYEELLKSKSDRIKVYKFNDEKHFRFDTVQNYNIDLIENKKNLCCISLDLDERLVKNWKSTLDKFFSEKLNIDDEFILFFNYVHSWIDKEHTIPDSIYKRNKIHSRNAGKWIYPVFDQFVPNDEETKILTIEEEIIHHHQKEKVGRNKLYEELIRTAIIEEPKVADYNFSYAEMLLSENEPEKAFQQWKFFLDKTDNLSLDFGGVAQRRSLALKNMAKCQIMMGGSPDLVLLLLLKAVGECPYYREIWMYLSQAWHNLGNSIQSIAAMEIAKGITDKNRSIVLESWCWDEEIVKKMNIEAFKTKD